jgi:hypothetical protein
MKASHVLILDPDVERREELVSTFRNGGHLPVPYSDPADAARALAVPGLELAVLALDIPGLDQTLLRQAVAPASPALPEPLDDVERRHIAVLAYTHGNKASRGTSARHRPVHSVGEGPQVWAGQRVERLATTQNTRTRPYRETTTCRCAPPRLATYVPLAKPSGIPFGPKTTCRGRPVIDTR